MSCNAGLELLASHGEIKLLTGSNADYSLLVGGCSGAAVKSTTGASEKNFLNDQPPLCFKQLMLNGL